MKFYIKQKVFSFKDKFKVFDENENIQYQVFGKFFSFTNKLEFVDHNENVILRAHKQLFRFLAKYQVYDHDGMEVASVKRIFSITPKFELNAKGRTLNVDGNFFAHSFNITDNGSFVASIQKKYISWGDTYEIDIVDEKNIQLLLFLVIIIDQVVHENKNNR